MKQTFVVKQDVNINDLMFLSPKLLLIFAEFCIFANSRFLPVVVTSILDDAQGRKTKTHAEGRAIDLSVKGWSDKDIREVSEDLSSRFQHIAAISSSDLKPRAVVYHSVIGGQPHFHLQVRP